MRYVHYNEMATKDSDHSCQWLQVRVLVYEQFNEHVFIKSGTSFVSMVIWCFIKNLLLHII